MPAYQRDHVGRCLVRHQAQVDPGGRGGADGVGRPGVRTPRGQPRHGQRRADGRAFSWFPAAFAEELRGLHRGGSSQQFSARTASCQPGPFTGSRRPDLPVEARHGDPAAGIPQGRDHPSEHQRRVGNFTAQLSRMQGAARPGHPEPQVHQASQTRYESGPIVSRQAGAVGDSHASARSRWPHRPSSGPR